MVRPRRYPPIQDYALLADCHSAALVSRDGSLDWACLRRFDAPSVFGRLLDWERGGCFAITPTEAAETTRRYMGESLVLETTMRTATGSVRLVDAFAMRRGGGRDPRHQLLRVVEGVDGHVELRVVIEPRFDYGHLRPWLRQHTDGVFSAVGGSTALVVTAGCPLELHEDFAWLHGRVTVKAGERTRFTVTSVEPHQLSGVDCPDDEVDSRLDETIDWWRRWSAQTRAEGPYAAGVRRSAVVLKGLTCAPTGAIVAAPTTSLPEDVGGERNWDYRFSWVRDSTFVLAALSVAGHVEVARGFRDFIMRSTAGRAEDLQIMYGVYGERLLPEVTLDLDGYRGSRPVRIGNEAAQQVQHDVYGHILDAAGLWRQREEMTRGKRASPPDDEWRFLRRLVAAAAATWQEPDRGLWEIRGEPLHFTQSKVMLWVALDRGIRTVENLAAAEGVHLADWQRCRADIRRWIDDHGVRDGHFVQHPGTDRVDAALLLLPMVGFVDAREPRMVRTVERIQAELSMGEHGFIKRYTEDGHDGLAGQEGAFLMCSFWLADVLAQQGRRDEAVALFERLLACANDVGLYAEEYDPIEKMHLGNFPQAFTHMALINTAHTLGRTCP